MYNSTNDAIYVALLLTILYKWGTYTESFVQVSM